MHGTTEINLLPSFKEKWREKNLPQQISPLPAGAVRDRPAAKGVCGRQLLLTVPLRRSKRALEPRSSLQRAPADSSLGLIFKSSNSEPQKIIIGTALAGWLGWLEHWTVHQNVVDLVPGWSEYGRQLINVSLSPSLSLPVSKITEHVLR